MKNYIGYCAGVDKDPDTEWEILLSYSLDKHREKKTLYPNSSQKRASR